MNTDAGALLKLADELAVLKEAVCDTRYSAAAVGLRVRNTWSTYEAGLLALRQAASQGTAEAAQASIECDAWIAYADKLESVLKIIAGYSVDELKRLQAKEGLQLVRPSAVSSAEQK